VASLFDGPFEGDKHSEIAVDDLTGERMSP
jgi:hypothetical protein